MALKKSLSNRRIPRKIGGDEDEDADSSSTSSSAPEPVVKRPSLASKTKKGSKLRMSFGPGEDLNNNDSDAAVTPKKSNIRRVAVENRARSSLASEHLPFRESLADEIPSYSKEYLEELRQSTPSTPVRKDGAIIQDEAASRDLDIASKFGALAALQSHQSSPIPTAAEIREKKERRARLAKEEQYMSLDPSKDPPSEDEPMSDDEFRPKRTKDFQIAEWKEQHKYGETRLEREDEDMAEGFEDFTEDGGIALGRKAEKEARKKRRAEIASMIADAEGGSSDDGSDDSEVDRNEAYEAAQARAGAYGSSTTLGREKDSVGTPAKIAPLPKLSDVTQRLRDRVKQMEEEKAQRMRRLEELKIERQQIAERETWIQSQLKETGDRYEKLRVEAGIAAGASTPLDGANGSRLITDRGLESLGATPAGDRSGEGSEDGT